jgi:hypothetical protein
MNQGAASKSCGDGEWLIADVDADADADSGDSTGVCKGAHDGRDISPRLIASAVGLLFVS